MENFDGRQNRRKSTWVWIFIIAVIAVIILLVLYEMNKSKVIKGDNPKPTSVSVASVYLNNAC